ncbi:M15 family metallopeptidase [Haliea sp. E1-2-M8]|uniref:M15 family metallopeptidase n=1 Tax=Haliea sp. E1-2-M8 TaxID=3064706 RepID=UPI0027221875|nr:M15 family metallopeptidase [Haliea sp. E1-2-M8]MDO8861589.1 M15 family metallopeptidase [Haliea sp. E1-2-M8]
MLTLDQITGRDAAHLVAVAGGHRLQAEAAAAFARLQVAAADAGFQLAVASSYRSYERQRVIWNGKAAGERPVHNDAGNPVAILALPAVERIRAILRFSALPGTSRHHWGTDLDVYDAAAVAADYAPQLSPREVAPGGLFDPLHCWLDARMAAGESHGFYRPYGVDRGGVAPERWHLSYAPLAVTCAGRLSEDLLRMCWDCDSEPLLLRKELEVRLPELLAQYVEVPLDWCPAQ